MSKQRTAGTGGEMALRRGLHRAGLRYRTQRPIMPGTRRRVDIVFSAARVAVFVDGCFWHGCPEHRTVPVANREWWAAKLAENRRRDEDTDARLAVAGWAVVRIWEHEDPAAAAALVARLVRERRPSARLAAAPATPRSTPPPC